MRPRLFSRKSGADVVGGGYPAEKAFYIVDRGILDEGRSGLRGGITDQKTEEFVMIGVAYRRLHANIGGDSGKDEIADVPRAQNIVERRAAKPAVARFWDHDIAQRWLEIIDKLVVPRSVDQDFALELWASAHGLERVRFVPVWRARSTGAFELSVPAVFQQDDRQTCGARGMEQPQRIHNHMTRGVDVLTDKFAIAAWGSVAVLQIGDDDGGLCQMDVKRLWAGINADRNGNVSINGRTAGGIVHWHCLKAKDIE